MFGADPENDISILSMEHSLEIFLEIFGRKINQGDVIEVEGAMDLLEGAFSKTGAKMFVIARHIAGILLNVEIDDPLKWRCLRRFNETFQLSSTLYKHFEKYSGELSDYLQKSNDVPTELVKLVVSLLRTSLPLLCSHDIYKLQKIVCLKALELNPSIEILHLLNALLEFSHEEVPLPLQVAHTVFWRNFDDREKSLLNKVERGRIICGTYSRPKNYCLRLNPTRGESQPTEVIEMEEVVDGKRRSITVHEDGSMSVSLGGKPHLLGDREASNSSANIDDESMQEDQDEAFVVDVRPKVANPIDVLDMRSGTSSSTAKQPNEAETSDEIIDLLSDEDDDEEVNFISNKNSKSSNIQSIMKDFIMD